jgi:hypothetical protein
MDDAIVQSKQNEFEQWWRNTGCYFDPASISEFSIWTPLTELAYKAGYDRGVKSVTAARGGVCDTAKSSNKMQST